MPCGNEEMALNFEVIELNNKTLPLVNDAMEPNNGTMGFDIPQKCFSVNQIVVRF